MHPLPEPLSEPWLRGDLPGVDPVIAPVLHALQQAREDLSKHSEGLSAEQIWRTPHGLAPLGFHLRHIAGSVDRLCTYLLGRQLIEDQLVRLRLENEPGAGREELLRSVLDALDQAESIIRGVDPNAFAEPRYVGRKRLPTTAIGLAIHIAEHTQRHVGQAISAAKLARVYADEY